MTAPRRPASLDPQELGFTPRKPVPWLKPLLLLNTGLRSLLALIFGAYLDKRELQSALPSQTYQQRGVPEPVGPYLPGELWLDFVADSGDGFDAGYSVAYLVGQPSLAIDDRELPRGQVLVLGGDQVYPTASMEGYEDRCKGPYESALPVPPPGGPVPTLYALPGNHDWYDGLTAFLRLFVRVRTDHIGGWQTEQSRSYFAVDLPHSWWLFAIDQQFGAYIDDPQMVYFEQAARQLGPGDRVILVVPEPSWVKTAVNPTAYDTIDYFIRTVIKPTGAAVRLVIAGDLHHYSRYGGPDRQLITCGGGGAYLSATHTLPQQLTVPPEATLVRKASPPQRYELAARYPSASASRAFAWGVFNRLPWRNARFAMFIGVLNTLLMLAIAGTMSAPGMDAAEQGLLSIPLVFMVLVTLLGTVGFAFSPTGSRRRRTPGVIAGMLHGAAHIALAWAGAWLWVRLPFDDWPWFLPAVAAFVLYLPVIALFSAELVAVYLLIAARFGVNVNELFAGQGIEDAKSFLRLHIGGDGTLTVYPIAVDRICRKWRADPGAARPDASWIVPDPPEVLRPRLAEAPVVIPR